MIRIKGGGEPLFPVNLKPRLMAKLRKAVTKIEARCVTKSVTKPIAKSKDVTKSKAGRPAVHVSAADRQKAYRARKKAAK